MATVVVGQPGRMVPCMVRTAPKRALDAQVRFRKVKSYRADRQKSPLSRGPSEWRDPDSNWGHHDFQSSMRERGMSRRCAGIPNRSGGDSAHHIAVHMVTGHTMATFVRTLVPYGVSSSVAGAAVSGASRPPCPRTHGPAIVSRSRPTNAASATR